MSYYSIKYILILILFFIVACDITRTVDYAIPLSEKKIVITGFIGLDNRAEVFISTSQQPLSLDEDSIYEAEVSLFEDGVLIENLIRNNESIYVSDGFNPKLGKTYEISTMIDGFPNAISELEIIPSPVKLDSVKYLLNMEQEVLIRLYFKDPPLKNYYAVKIIRSYNDTLVAKADVVYKIFNPSVVFNDKLFNSQIYTYERKLSLAAGRVNNKPLYYNHIDAILYSLTESGYTFFKDLDESDYTNGDMFTTSTQIRSNIINGYGIFAAYSTDTVKLNLDL
jgi:hypothetical protein